MSGWRARWRTIVGVGLALWLLGCTATEDRSPRALARVATHRDHLIGGPRALGEPGDFLLENDRIRILIQAPGDSRGFGVYGGSILDAVQVGPDAPGDQMRGPGNDAFGELFPAFFLQAMAVDEVVILDDGRDGGPARIAARGSAGDCRTPPASRRTRARSAPPRAPSPRDRPKAVMMATSAAWATCANTGARPSST